MSRTIYYGAFIDSEEFESVCDKISRLADHDVPSLDKVPKFPHVTFAFGSEAPDSAPLGSIIEIKAIGYACDGNNEAIQVEFDDVDGCPFLGEGTKHVTISTSIDGAPKNSRWLDFIPFENRESFVFKARLGKYTSNNLVEYK